MADKLSRVFFPGAYSYGDKKKEEDLAARLDREKLAASLYPKLIEQYTPEETSSIVRRLIEGEGVNLPTMRSKMLPPRSDVDVPTRSTLEPLKYIEPTTTVYNKDTGETTYIPGKNAKVYGNNANSEVDLVAADAETGTMKNMGKIKKGSKVIMPPKEKEGVDREKAQRFQLFKEKGKLRDVMSAQGMDTAEIDSELESMAPEHGYEYEELTKKPNWWQTLTGQDPQTTKTLKRTEIVPSSKKTPSGKYKTAADVKVAYKAGSLSKEEAASILKSQFEMK